MFPPFTACPTNFIMPGLDRILRGVLKYRADLKPQMVKQFEKIKDNPEPKCVMFSCMDSRIIMTRVLQSDVGDMFLVRNAGNLVPHSDSLTYDAVTTEPGALELGCVVNNIRHVVVCGHSDCKAMNLLFSVREALKEKNTDSPLQTWLKKHGAPSVAKFDTWEAGGGNGSIEFQAERPDKHFEAFIDPDQKFKMVDKFSQPQCVMFCCIDSRVIITRVLQTDVGDMFLVRNAGNLVPPGDCVNAAAISTEPGALELGCVINGIRHVVVCGHSDCKAMGLLYSVKDSLAEPTTSPLQMWVKRYGAPSIEKYNNLKASGESGGGPLVFRAEEPTKRFEAYIDPEDKFKDLDKLSQINTLQQLENIASHQFLHDKLQKNEVRLHAMWFDVCTGDFYMFNREKKKFVEITEESFNDLIKDGESCAGQ